jgi:RimJ/RimL family protein N-acetyltransferase
VHKRFHEGGYASDEYELFFICKPTGEVIGDVVHFLAKRYATARELGWCIYAPEDRQHGYATEAVTALVDYLFKSHPIHRIECHTSVDNHASLRLAEKCGFVREGIARGLVFIAGSFVDDVMLSILRHEWTPLPASSQTHTQSQADTWA